MARPVKKDNPLSKCIRTLLTDANMYNTEGIEDVAEVLGKGVPVFRNKLSNGTFSIEELLAIVALTGGTMGINSRSVQFRFLPEEFCNEETLKRLKAYEKKLEERRMQKLGEMFGIDDPETLKRMYEDILKERNKNEIDNTKI